MRADPDEHALSVFRLGVFVGITTSTDLPLMQAHHIDPITGEDEISQAGLMLAQNKPRIDPNNPKTWGKVSRNDPCPCGSGKRYKHCHGAYA